MAKNLGKEGFEQRRILDLSFGQESKTVRLVCTELWYTSDVQFCCIGKTVIFYSF